jgi:hypothetical protein
MKFKTKTTFRINATDLSPIDTITIHNLSSLPFSIAMIAIERLDYDSKTLTEVVVQLEAYLSNYSSEYLCNVIPQDKIRDIVTRAVFLHSQGLNNLGRQHRTQLNGEIVLNLNSLPVSSADTRPEVIG